MLLSLISSFKLIIFLDVLVGIGFCFFFSQTLTHSSSLTLVPLLPSCCQKAFHFSLLCLIQSFRTLLVECDENTIKSSCSVLDLFETMFTRRRLCYCLTWLFTICLMQICFEEAWYSE
ncbi:hypothetical protein I3842_01G258000 [Carya illinoinensis]|uniref:Uncharacterized protein n=1 Tax=Carya illinoinensis TaxID=32201 RepID=A0A922G4W0_CARIL|nr:hypothetical protein I3842_01G258000 [Carya illinoinensis]